MRAGLLLIVLYLVMGWIAYQLGWSNAKRECSTLQPQAPITVRMLESPEQFYQHCIDFTKTHYKSNNVDAIFAYVDGCRAGMEYRKP